MIIRKATQNDIDDINKIYNKIHYLEEKGLVTIGWIKDVYPTIKTAKEALTRDDLFVIEDEGTVVASAIINQIQVNEYKNANWKYDTKENEVMVLHCLVADPNKSGKGYGKEFVSFYENYAKKHNCLELRMDTNARNTKARALYKKLDYQEIDIVDCTFNGIPNVKLVCLEKYLERDNR